MGTSSVYRSSQRVINFAELCFYCVKRQPAISHGSPASPVHPHNARDVGAVKANVFEIVDISKEYYYGDTNPYHSIANIF
ncbi:unnamed protein product [Haemonchus placei]|uniref:Uncharacterized protein n=1 Tax=Haemonchus placei TaxID=6290 RepID=A0A0N4X4F8_HAEPC|nr:unnamed protein product [Haemonchus placei]